MLRSLELSGFKSFAKKTVLEFNSPITAIVGPNGSGKSNVAEAFAWVLGEQSLKSLRGKRGEDFIWSGTPKVPRQSRAAVTVTFDNYNKRLNIEYEEVSIAREVYRDGTNEYLINGSKVRLKDIVELLSGVGLGVSNHHIISQGEADRILNANAQERRAMIQDALGLKIYHYKIEEAQRKLEKTRENIKQAESLRREIAPHLKFLEKQVGEAQRALKLREELRALYDEYFVREKGYLQAQSEKLKTENDNVKLKIAEIEEKLKQGEAGEHNLGVLENSLAEIRKEKDELSRSLGKLEGMIEAGKKSAEVIAGKSCPTCGQVITKEVVVEKSGKGDQELKHLENERREVVGDMSRLSDEEKEVGARLEELKKSHEAGFELRAKRSQLVGQLDTTHTQEEKLKLEESDYARELQEAKALVGYTPQTTHHTPIEPRDAQAERRRKIERIKIKLEDSNVAGDDVLKEYEATQKREEFLAREVEDLNKTIKSLNELIESLGGELGERFKGGITLINKQFQEFFSLMFGGGEASLALIKPEIKTSEAPLEDETSSNGEGIEIKVNLPRKKIKGLQMLSGGERALTSIALLFALSQVNPPPFLVLDETDAALDEANSSKYGEMIKALSRKTQLILITHNRVTMGHAGVLYGVTMGAEGVSKLLSIKFDEAKELVNS